jgi:hypothetical protein
LFSYWKSGCFLDGNICKSESNIYSCSDLSTEVACDKNFNNLYVFLFFFCILWFGLHFRVGDSNSYGCKWNSDSMSCVVNYTDCSHITTNSAGDCSLAKERFGVYVMIISYYYLNFVCLFVTVDT